MFDTEKVKAVRKKRTDKKGERNKIKLFGSSVLQLRMSYKRLLSAMTE